MNSNSLDFNNTIVQPLTLDGLQSISADIFSFNGQPAGVLQLDQLDNVYSSSTISVDAINSLSNNLILVNTDIFSNNDIIVTGNFLATTGEFNFLQTNDLIVSNNATFGSLLSISALSVINNVNINGNLNVFGNATFGSNVSINQLSLTNLSLNQLVATSIINTDLLETQSLLVNDIANMLNLQVIQFATFNDFFTLRIGADIGTFGSNLSTNNLFVSNNTILNTNLIVSGNATFGSNLSTSNLFVNNNTILNGTLTVNSNSTFNVPIFVSGSIRLNGNVEYADATVLVGRGDNGLNFRTNNLNRMVISQNGNIGIGLANPLARLDISGRARINSLSTADSSAVLEFRPSNGTTNFLFVNNSNDLVSTANLRCPRIFQTGEAHLAINGNHFLELVSGNDNAFIDFHSFSGNPNDRDARILCFSGESGTNNRGEMFYQAKQHIFETTTVDTVFIDSKSNMGLGVSPRCRLDVRIDNDAGGDNPVMILDNKSTTANTLKNVYLQFRGSDTVGTNKDLGGIRYTPNDTNYINGSTLIQGRRSNGIITSLQMNHNTQEMIFSPNGTTGFFPSIYLNGRTNSGQEGVRIHYDSTTSASGGARFDLRANIISQTMRFRADTTNGLTDLMRLEQGGNCIITRELTVGLMTSVGNVDTFHNSVGTLGIQASDIRTKKEVESFDYELDEIWRTIKPIKYFYKTKNSNQIDEFGMMRKTYGINASILHRNIKQINKNIRVEICEKCQTRNEDLECECEKFEMIDSANYCSRDIISLSISKINQQENKIHSLQNTIETMKQELVKERIAYKIEKERMNKAICDLQVSIGKIRLFGIKC